MNKNNFKGKKYVKSMRMIIFLLALLILFYAIYLNLLPKSDLETYIDTKNLSFDDGSKLNNFSVVDEDTVNNIILSEIKISNDGVKYIVDPDKIQSGGPPKDGIPSIDHPKFVSMDEADVWIADNELVLVINYNGIKRVYPLQIMVWHELVNDVIDGDPILITYCPLCGSGIAYKGEINGETVEFGTSGKLYNSNLIMYDRKTDTYWTQIGGEAIIGELTGMKLETISIDTVVWRDWKENNLDSQVLSKDTGYNRNYGRDPYGNYYEDSFIMFPLENSDERIHPKTIIFGIEVDGIYIAYKESDLKNADDNTLDQVSEIIDDKSISGTNIKISRSKSGIITVLNLNTNKEIIKERDMWFAWYAFHPETILYGFKENE